MSFFKKVTKELNELKTIFTDPEVEKKKARNTAAANALSYDTRWQLSNNSSFQPPAASSHPNRQYTQPSSTYGTPVVVGAGHFHVGAPSCPPGWTSHFDAQSQRWYFVNISTGQTQWDLPASGVYGAPGDHFTHQTIQSYGQEPRAFGGVPGYEPVAQQQIHGGHTHYIGQGHAQHAGQNPHSGQGQDWQQGQHSAQAKQHADQAPATPQNQQKSSKGRMLKVAAGGLAVAAVLGGLLGIETDGDDEVRDDSPPETTYEDSTAPTGYTDSVPSNTYMDYQPPTAYPSIAETSMAYSQQNNNLFQQSAMGSLG